MYLVKDLNSSQLIISKIINNHTKDTFLRAYNGLGQMIKYIF